MIYQIEKTQEDVAKAMYLADGNTGWEIITHPTRSRFLGWAEVAAREMGVRFADPPMPLDPRMEVAMKELPESWGDVPKEKVVRAIIAAIDEDRRMR